MSSLKQEDIQKIRARITLLNQYRDAYYNDNQSSISDAEYDALFDELKQWEDQFQVYYSDSPTQSVGYESRSYLKKVKHNPLLLSLDKTKEITEVCEFAAAAPSIVMLKYDGLTVEIDYMDGKLVQASTRGNGIEGEDITHSVKKFKNVPAKIPVKGSYRVVGEAIIHWDDFERINADLPEPERFKTPRNLVSGTVRQLDNQVCAQRFVYFMPWDVLEGNQYPTRGQELLQLGKYGFTVPDLYGPITEPMILEQASAIIDTMKERAKFDHIPIDGMVVKYNDFQYARSCGSTSHHNKDGLAFKFIDEQCTTILKSIEWGMGRTGVITPVAIFDPVLIDGTMVQRATLCNISMMRKLKIQIGDTIEVRKANMIIPQVMRNVSAEEENRTEYAPDIAPVCPLCGAKTTITSDGTAEVLACSNPNCRGRLTQQIVHYTGKNQMNINGFGSERCASFVANGVIRDFVDIYHLEDAKSLILSYCNLSPKQLAVLIDAVETSRKTTLYQLLGALSIPRVGSVCARAIASDCDYDVNQFHTKVTNHIPFATIGDAANLSIQQWFEDPDHAELFNRLVAELSFHRPEENTVQNKQLAMFAGKAVCITGNFSKFSRAELQELLSGAGAKVKSGVSPRTDYLFVGGTGGGGKLAKAQEYQISIITEQELYQMLEVRKCIK